MVKIIKYNCVNLNFIICKKCKALIQYKMPDVYEKTIVCPNCNTVLDIKF